jgi:hypothetical protein
MQLTIIKSKHKIENVEDFKKASKYVAFQFKEGELDRKKALMLLENAYYLLFEKEKHEKLREEMKSLEGKKDDKLIKRVMEILGTVINK